MGARWQVQRALRCTHTHTCGLILLFVCWFCTCCDPRARAANTAMLQASCSRCICRTNVSLESQSDFDQMRPFDLFISICGRHRRYKWRADLLIGICWRNPRGNSWQEPEWLDHYHTRDHLMLVERPSTWAAPASLACSLHPIFEMSGFSLSSLLVADGSCCCGRYCVISLRLRHWPPVVFSPK